MELNYVTGTLCVARHENWVSAWKVLPCLDHWWGGIVLAKLTRAEVLHSLPRQRRRLSLCLLGPTSSALYHTCSIQLGISTMVVKSVNSWLQCFDAVGWAAGRVSGLQKTEGRRGWHGYLSGVRCSKIQTRLTFLVLAHPGRAVKRVWACVL